MAKDTLFLSILHAGICQHRIIINIPPFTFVCHNPFMGPETLALLIPILALSIPIVAIISKAATRRQQVDPAQAQKIAVLEERVRELDNALSRVNGDVERLEDKR